MVLTYYMELDSPKSFYIRAHHLKFIPAINSSTLGEFLDRQVNVYFNNYERNLSIISILDKISFLSESQIWQLIDFCRNCMDPKFDNPLYFNILDYFKDNYTNEEIIERLKLQNNIEPTFLIQLITQLILQNISFSEFFNLQIFSKCYELNGQYYFLDKISESNNSIFQALLSIRSEIQSEQTYISDVIGEESLMDKAKFICGRTIYFQTLKSIIENQLPIKLGATKDMFCELCAIGLHCTLTDSAFKRESIIINAIRNSLLSIPNSHEYISNPTPILTIYYPYYLFINPQKYEVTL